MNCEQRHLAKGRGRLTVLITAGPTREYLDPVRFLSNDSSGKMGFALAEEFKKRGARVRLISGPVNLKPPHDISFHNVVSAQEMFSSVKKYLREADVFISTAAVSDWRFGRTFPKKMKKNRRTSLSFFMKKNPDILAWAGSWKLGRSHKEAGDVKEGGVKSPPERQPTLRRSSGDLTPPTLPVLIGFALETGNVKKEALSKLKKKNLDLIIGNTIRTFGSGKIRPRWIERGGKAVPLRKMSKKNLARRICRWVLRKMAAGKNV